MCVCVCACACTRARCRDDSGHVLHGLPGYRLAGTDPLEYSVCSSRWTKHIHQIVRAHWLQVVVELRHISTLASLSDVSVSVLQTLEGEFGGTQEC